ncbi:MAG: VOC family protein [Actinomycetia bacterium]|nr:VOC family protein [Actinomycetes bacterium]
MTSRFEGCAIDCADPAMLSQFWAAALGYSVLEERDDLVEIGPGGGTDEGYLAALRSGPVAPSLVFVRVPEPKSGKNRLHFDISPIDDDQDGEVSRLESLGARATDLAPAGASWVVMIDPEGNEFCVVRSLAPGHFSL